jgi:hypothetical protein
MLRPLCPRWAYGSGPDAHPEHTHQFLTRMLSMRISFPIFQMFILYTLSMRVRNWCLHWACASGIDACTEHARQELMRMLSIRVRNWCVHWAYASGTNACTERIPFKKCWAYALGTDASLSIRVRNWCVRWAYESGTDAYPEHTHQFLTRILSISIKIPNLKEVPPNHAEHTCKELVRMLSIRVRNWCACWSYASVPYVYAQHARQKLNAA